jgi:hypothetical protein
MRHVPHRHAFLGAEIAKTMPLYKILTTWISLIKNNHLIGQERS